MLMTGHPRRRHSDLATPTGTPTESPPNLDKPSTGPKAETQRRTD
jgi:hypothetical protein